MHLIDETFVMRSKIVHAIILKLQAKLILTRVCPCAFVILLCPEIFIIFIIIQSAHFFQSIWSYSHCVVSLYLVFRFLQAYEKHGIRLWGLTAQNEPSDGYIVDFSFQAMGWTPESQRDYIALDLGPALEASGYGDLKLMILDDQRIFLPEWAERVTNITWNVLYISEWICLLCGRNCIGCFTTALTIFNDCQCNLFRLPPILFTSNMR